MVDESTAAKGGVQIRQHAQVDCGKLKDEERAGDGGIDSHAGRVQQKHDLDVGEDIHKVEPDDDSAIQGSLEDAAEGGEGRAEGC